MMKTFKEWMKEKNIDESKLAGAALGFALGGVPGAALGHWIGGQHSGGGGGVMGPTGYTPTPRQEPRPDGDDSHMSFPNRDLLQWVPGTNANKRRLDRQAKAAQEKENERLKAEKKAAEQELFRRIIKMKLNCPFCKDNGIGSVVWTDVETPKGDYSIWTCQKCGNDWYEGDVIAQPSSEPGADPKVTLPPEKANFGKGFIQKNVRESDYTLYLSGILSENTYLEILEN